MRDERTRADGRSDDALRPVHIELRPLRHAEASVLYRCGNTTVLCVATIEDTVRDFLRGTGRGWLTAEYAMHPCASGRRQARDGRRGPIDGRVQEIQRLVGRSLRAALRLDALGERTITVDCDVLDADGGTRTASITGGFVAVALLLDGLRKGGLVDARVIREPVAAVSAGWVGGRARLDLCYEEDADAEVDLNVVGTQSGALVEVQGTAEGAPVDRDRFERLVELGLRGVAELVELQRRVLEQAGVRLAPPLR
ncbi:MAG: ribonuclease PH [Myxococcota bacterium]|nr:ribonuclease PH [Myxococcota bacterium]MDW8363350.1 ribonuclease PH [Myxococcales bacterium]